MVVDVGELRLDDLQRYVERTFRHVAEVEERRLRHPTSTRDLPQVDVHRRQAPAADHQEPAVERVQVHAPGQVTLAIEPAPSGWSRDNEELNRAGQVLAFAVTRHRHRHPAGQAADHLRGVPAGRRLDQPQVRRHRPRPGDQPRAVAAARRRDPAGERARRRAARSRCTCRRPTCRRAPARQAARRPSGARAGRVARRQPRPPTAAEAAGRRHARSTATPEAAGRAARQRGRRRPRRHPAGRPRAADRRERPGVRPFLLDAAREQGLQGPGHVARARPRWRWRASTSPTPITLDIFLPDIDGWRVLDRLKNDLATRHIPVCVDLDRRRARARARVGRARLRRQADPVARRSLDELLDELHGYRRRGRRKHAARGRADERRARRDCWTRSTARTSIVVVADEQPTARDAAAQATRRLPGARRPARRRRAGRPASSAIERSATALGQLPVVVYGRAASRRRTRWQSRRLHRRARAARGRARPSGCSTDGASSCTARWRELPEAERAGARRPAPGRRACWPARRC